MEFRLLGPLEVSVDGRALVLGGPKQRGVLALLLLNAGQVVSIDRLIDELWGERAPKTVEAYIQNCVSRLRRVLGAELIERRSPGYVLRVEPGRIDAHRFEQAVAAAASIAPLERSTALREALALWHGPALADLAFERFAQDEAARLDELRLSALEQRLEAELELGHHAEAIAELDALARRHPTRERLRELQMLALYRSGRQRDALRVYQETRLELVEQLGLEPGEGLRALERQIIAQDPSLSGAPDETPSGDEPPRRAVMLAFELTAEGERDRVATLAEIELVVGHYGGSLAGESLAFFATHDDDVVRALSAVGEIAAMTPLRAAVERDVDEAAALRLLEVAAAGELLLGPRALELVPAAVEVVPHERGAGYRVLSFDPRSDPFQRHFDAPLVGREAELERLESALESAVEAGAPRRIVVVGEPGIGKTRLARELIARVAGSARVLSGRCVAYGKGAALLPLVEILRQVGPFEDELAGEPDVDRVAERLREPSSYDKSEGFWAFRRLLEGLARSLPVLLVLEDAHWATPTLLDLVDYLGGWTDAPLLLLVLGRTSLLDARPEWRDDALMLEPLSHVEASELAATFPGLEPERLGHAVEAAEGNPLFLEQLLAFSGDEPPPTLEALIAGRIDQLPAVERAVLERAAVIGRLFWRAVVEGASPDGEREGVSAALMALARRGLVHPDRSALAGEDGFRYHHGLIRDVVYAGIPPAVRAELHELVARVLDVRHAELDELVGYHLEQAAIVNPALARAAGLRLGTAGTRVTMRDARAASDLLGRAIALLPEGDSRRQAELALGTAIKFAGNWPSAERQLLEVAAKAAGAGDRRVELRAEVELLLPRLSRGAVTREGALELLQRAIGVCELESDEIGLARCWHLMAAVLGGHAFRVAEAERAAALARSHYTDAGVFAGAALALLASALHEGPTPVPDAVSRCNALLVQAETPVWQSFVRPHLAGLEAMAGRFDSARAQLEEAFRGRRGSDDPQTIVIDGAWYAGQVELLAGENERAIEILEPAVAELRRTGDRLNFSTNAGALAEACYRLGRFDEARALSHEAVAASPPDFLYARVRAERINAKAMARAGETRQARASIDATLRNVAGCDAVDEHGHVLAAAAEIAELAGDVGERSRFLSESLAMFERKENVAMAQRVRDALLTLS